MDQDKKKTIDKDWKEQVNKEKQTHQENNQPYHKPDFNIFISSLSMQAMIALGRLENPVTKKQEKNYDQARYLIDTLEIIEAKTKNNLDDQERKLLDESLFSLRMAYLEEKKNG
jgi:hypothetical protein